MATSFDPPPRSLDFLQGEPAPVSRSAAEAAVDPADVLAQSTADHLLTLDDVVGAWIERDAQGRREVCVHVSRPGGGAGVPRFVDGMPTRLVGGAPIRAGL